MIASTLAIAIGVADVRREPNAASELVTQALLNTPAQVDEEQGAWTHVMLPDYSGWVRSDELDEPPVKGFCRVGNGECCATPLALNAVISVPQTPLYAERRGEMCLERSAITICVGNSFAALYPRQPLATVTSYACQYLNVPYLWGGTTVQG